MAGSATLNVKVLVDAAQAASGLNAVAGKFESFAGKAVKLFAGAFAVDKLIGGVKSVVNAAADMEQAIGGTDRIFGESAKSIHEWASNTEDAFRVPALEAEKFATSMGNSLQQAGQSSAQAAQQVKTLGQVAADLASAYGGDVVDALDAVNAAISKGEWERLESFGVTIKASDVSAEVERIAASMGGLSDANRSAVETQAKINLLMKEAAPAAGAAAAETLTFTGRVDALKEKLNNAAGTIGGPLLDGLGGFLDRVMAIVPALTTLGTALGAAVGWIVQLPAPLFNAAAAMAAFALAAAAGWVSSLVSGFTAARTAIISFIATARAAQAQAIASGGSMSMMGAMARTGVAGVSQFAGALKTIGVGAAIGVAVIAITGLIEKMTAAGRAFDDVQSGLGDVTAELRKTGGEWTDTAESMFNAKFADSKAFQQLVQEGFTANEIIQALTGSYEDWYAVQASSKGAGLSTETIDEVNAYRDLHGILPQVAIEQGKFNQETQKTIPVVKTFEDALKETNEIVSAAKTHLDILASQTGVAQMLDGIAAAQERVTRGSAALNAMFEQADGRSSSYEQSVLDTTTAITGLGDGMKEAHDAGVPIADLISNWDWGGIRNEMPDVASGLLAVRKSMGESTMAAFEAADGFHNYEAGLAAASTQMAQNEADFRRMLHSAGLADDQIDQIVGTMEEFNQTTLEEKIAKIALEDFEARKKALYWSTLKFDPIEQKWTTNVPDAQTIADQLNANLPKPPPEIPLSTIVNSPTSYPPGAVGAALQGGTPEATGQIRVPSQIEQPKPAPGLGAFGNYLVGGSAAPVLPTINVPTAVQPPTSVPPGPVGAAVTTGGAQQGGQVNVDVSAPAIPDISAGLADIASRSVSVIVTADTGPAWSAATLFASATAALHPIVHIGGDNTEAVSSIRAVTTGRYDTTVFVKGDNAAAIKSIRDVTTGRYETTVFVKGDNSDAISSIRGITTGYYSATVYIGADASNFYSVWNSLPTSRTITVTVNQVQGSVVAPPPGGRSAPASFAAAPAADLMAFAAAPRMPARAGRSGGGGSSSTTNITIEAGIGDPDAIARAVKRVIVGRDRRTGGVVAGGTRRAL